MGTTERRTREKERRRKNIVDATEQLFLSQEIDTVTMDQIAELAELSKGTLYLYFTNKDDLFFAVRLKQIKLLKKMLEEELPKRENSLDKLRAIGEVYTYFFRQYPAYAKILMTVDPIEILKMLEPPNAVECAKILQWINQLMIDLIEQGKAEKLLRPDLDPPLTSLVLSTLTSGLMHVITRFGEMLEDRYGFSPEQFTAYALDIIGFGIVKKNLD